MAAKPSTQPEWGSAGDAEIVIPATSKQQKGWVVEKPAHEWWNWWMNLVYQWLVYFDLTTARWTTLESFVAASAAGDTGIVDEYDLGTQPGTQAAIRSTSYAAGAGIDCDGERVIVGGTGGSQPFSTSRTDIASDNVTYARTNSGTITQCLIDGTYAVVAYDRYVECFNASTGSSLWVYDYGATNTVNDIAMDGTRVYAVGDKSTSQLVAITIAGGGAGTEAWNYNHNADLESVATDGFRVYVAGAASGHASGANLRSVIASNGKDNNNEGGNGADAVQAWDIVTTNAVNWRHCVATDGTHLAIGYPTGAQHLEVRSCASGNTIASAPMGGNDARGVAIDHELILFSDTNGDLYAVDKRTLAHRWLYNPATSTAFGVATDGAAVFISKGDGDAERVVRGNRPQLWRRVATTDDHLPMRQQAIPGVF